MMMKYILFPKFEFISLRGNSMTKLIVYYHIRYDNMSVLRIIFFIPFQSVYQYTYKDKI